MHIVRSCIRPRKALLLDREELQYYSNNLNKIMKMMSCLRYWFFAIYQYYYGIKDYYKANNDKVLWNWKLTFKTRRCNLTSKILKEDTSYECLSLTEHYFWSRSVAYCMLLLCVWCWTTEKLLQTQFLLLWEIEKRLCYRLTTNMVYQKQEKKWGLQFKKSV